VPFHCLNVLWAFFLFQDQNYEFDVQAMQGMRCIICYNNMLMPESIQSSQSTMKARKGLLQYNLAHGNVSMKKHLLMNIVKNMLNIRENQDLLMVGEMGGRSACKK